MISSEGSLQQTIENNRKGILVLHFTASWSESCKTVISALVVLQKKHPTLKVHQVETELVGMFCEKHQIESVPTCIIYNGSNMKEKVSGLNMPRIVKTVEKLLADNDDNKDLFNIPEQSIEDRLKSLTKMGKCVCFIKGSPQEPRCKFTRALMDMFHEKHVAFSYFDILGDEEVRQELKTFADWPTYPQVWLDGELLGGLDIMKEMLSSGKLTSILPCKEPLEIRLKNLINSSPVMLFMKGEPDQPRCGFSKQTIAVLSEYKDLSYKTFDILRDNEVRQGLKTYSDWPTYPQLYVNGELIGGIDIIKEMHQNGELETVLKQS